MEQNKMEALLNLMNNEEARKTLELANDSAEVCEVLKQYEIDITPEEVDEICAIKLTDDGKELAEDALEMVAGGVKKCEGKCTFVSVLLGIVAGGCVGIATWNPAAAVAAGTAVAASSKMAFNSWLH